MAKFCGNCGSQQPDNARVCGNCGAPFRAPAPNGAARPAPRPVANNNIDPAKKANLMKYVKMAAAVLAIIIAIVLVVNIITACTSGNYKTVVKQAMKAMEKGNEKKIAAMMTDAMTSEMAKDSAEDIVEDFEDTFDDYKIKGWEISDTEKADKDDVKDMREAAKDMYDEIKEAIKDDDIDKDDVEDMGINLKYKPNKIKGMMSVEVEVTAKDDDGDKYECTIEFELIKEGVAWKISDVYIGYLN